jgi:hypothetical protein
MIVPLLTIFLTCAAAVPAGLEVAQSPEEQLLDKRQVNVVFQIREAQY